MLTTKTKKRRATALSVRERLFIQGIAAGKNTYQAAISAGYAPSTAKSDAYYIQENPRIRRAIEEIFEDNGLSFRRLIQVLKNGMEATKMISVPVTYIDKDGKQIGQGHKKQRMLIEVPDFQMRLKFLMIWADLAGFTKRGGI